MPFVVYLDEAGDHSLEREDKDFPLFVLVMFICEAEHYVGKLVPAVYALKFDYFGHEGVILHSRDIRRAQDSFLFLRDATKRQPFYERINSIMRDSEYTLIASVIHKQQHKERYGMAAENPYDLALMFCLERLVRLLEDARQAECRLIAEARGKNEDDQLRLSFLSIVNRGTDYVSAKRFKKIQFELVFLSKKMNIVGTQLADLAAYPIARYLTDPEKPHPAYDIIKEKFHKKNRIIMGLKIFP